MKKISLILLAFTFVAQSCGQKKIEGTSNYKRKMVLSAFADLNNPSTLNMKELSGLPRVVDLKDAMTIVKDQGERGTCSFFSTMALVEASIKKDLRVEANLSEEFLNHQTKEAGFFSRVEGSVVHYNLAALKAHGILLESQWPYQPSWFDKGLPCAKYKSTDSNAPKNCFSHNRPTEKIMEKVIPADGFETIRVPNNTNAVIKFLATEKRPLTFSIMVNQNGWPESGDIFYNDALRLECLKAPESCGGHSMTLTGYDLDKKVFFLKNSYGEEWGRKGYGTVTFDTIDRFSSGDYISIKLKGALSLPDEDMAGNLGLKDFRVKSKLEADKTLSIKATGELLGAEGRYLYVSSFLVKQPITSKEAPNDNNVQSVMLSEKNALNFNDGYVRSVQHFSPDSHGDHMLWDEAAPLDLNIPAEMINIPEVTSVLNGKTDKSFLRTTIYSFTDTGYKVLKRIYHPLNQI